MGTFSAFEKENWKTQAANEPSWPCPTPTRQTEAHLSAALLLPAWPLSGAVADMGLGHTSEDTAQPGPRCLPRVKPSS